MNSVPKKREKASLDWQNLPFGYIKTKSNIRYYYKDGVWSNGELVHDEYIPVHMAAPALNYGQQAFEGLKAFTTKDNKVVVFRPDENAKRMQYTCERMLFPELAESIFIEAVERVVADNIEYVPPYGTGASLYLRPLILGTGPKVGLGPAPDYTFMVYVTPVGPYYKSGFKPVNALVLEKFDRAAPQGVGDCKVGGNYAAGLSGQNYATSQGFPIALYLDSKEKKFVDEFGTSNFIGIKDKTYITPESQSILPSITNKSLAILAEDMGYSIERRPIPIEEVKTFEEIGAVGTAAVLTPIHSITYRDNRFIFGKEDEAGPTLTLLYEKLTSLQRGEIDDIHNWNHEIKI